MDTRQIKLIDSLQGTLHLLQHSKPSILPTPLLHRVLFCTFESPPRILGHPSPGKVTYDRVIPIDGSMRKQTSGGEPSFHTCWQYFQIPRDRRFSKEKTAV